MTPQDRYIDRRRFLASGLTLGAGLVVGPGLLAACSTDSSGGGSSNSNSQAASGGASSSAGASTGKSARYLSDFKAYDPSAPAGSAPKLPKRVIFTVPTINEYYKQISDGIKSSCSARGLEYQIVSSENDPAKNIDQINQALQRGVGGLVIQPDDTKAQAEPIKRALEQGVCVIFFVTAPAIVETAADQFQLGYDQAVKAVEWIKGNLDGKANVVNFTFDHIEALIPRHKGTIAGLKTGGSGIKLVFEQELQDNTADEGFKFASTIAQAHSDVNVWIGPDDPGLGVASFLKSQGKDPAKDKILVTGLNGGVAGKAAVSSGKSFLRQDLAFADPVIAYSYGEFIADWLEGKSIPQVITVNGNVLTNKAQVDAFNKSLADPAETVKKVKTGESKTVGFLGNINYDQRANYLRINIGGKPK